MVRVRFLALVCGFAATLALPAEAGLGGRLSSVDNDRARFSARLSRAAALGYTVHTLTLDTGVEVREFTGADGSVFAVTWQGPIRPDLKTLFGASYFERFQADNAPGARIRMRGALSATHSDFVVRSGGHSGALWGFAYLPQSLPAAFGPDQLAPEAQ